MGLAGNLTLGYYIDTRETFKTLLTKSMDKETMQATRLIANELMKRTDNSGEVDNAISLVVEWLDKNDK